MNKIDLEKQLSKLYSTLDYLPLSANAISIYLVLLQVARKTGWKSEFRVANTTLMSKIKGISLSAFKRARNELINQNLINYKKGINQNDASVYSIVVLQDEPPNGLPNGLPNEPPNELADGLIITKLNLFYKYINKGEKNGHEIGLSEKDRPAIINLLKRYQLFMPKETIVKYENSMPENVLLDYKIQIYAIKELYSSPYRAGFNANILSYDKIAMKFLKAKKYMDSQYNSSLTEFIKYFIACLQELLENC